MRANHPANLSHHALTVERHVWRGATCLELSGAIDKRFDGTRLIAHLPATTLVLRLGGVESITEPGVERWVELMRMASQRCDTILLYECSPALLRWANASADFTGASRIASFYAPYRCRSCDASSRVLIDVARDWDAIEAANAPPRPCAACGEMETLDDDPNEYFAAVIRQGPVPVHPAAAAMLARSRRGLYVDKTVRGQVTHLQLGGVLDAFFPREKLSHGLEGTVVIDLSCLRRVHATGAIAWRRFLDTVATTSEEIYLMGVPPELVQELTCAHEMEKRVLIVTLSLPYVCSSCATLARYILDIRQRPPSQSELPAARCHTCQAPVRAAVCESFGSRLALLPQPKIPARVRRLLRAPGRFSRMTSKASSGGHRRLARAPLLTPQPAPSPVAAYRALSWSMSGLAQPVVLGALAAALLTAAFLWLTKGVWP